jgi:hypothetical protein
MASGGSRACNGAWRVWRWRAVTGAAHALVGLILAGHAGAQPPAYSGAEIRGRVVDAETKEPLAGVHVVAQWILTSGMVHPQSITRLQILETVTDAKGEYHLPAWGPKPRPFLTELDTADPRLTFFRPGYRMLDRSNQAPHHDSLRTSRWHGQTIDLEPFRGSPEEWVAQLQFVQMRLTWGDSTDHVVPQVNDNWKLMPRAVLAVVEQRQLLPARLRHRVRDLQDWKATEAELRALVPQKGLSP